VTIRGAVTNQKPNFAEYYRQGAACLALAQLTDISSIKVRWLRMARTWFTLAEKTFEARRDGCEERRSERSPAAPNPPGIVIGPGSLTTSALILHRRYTAPR
jgi:hypothetical protein